MSRALVALGSNLGDRPAQLQAAIAALAAHQGVELLAQSRPLATMPVGGPTGQGEFLNAAVLLETALSPRQLLALLQETEAALGRQRHARWDERTIDLDLLLYDELVLDTQDLQLPHPRMVFRRFVLAPAAEVAASLRHPPTGRTVGELLAHLDTAAQFLALAGADGKLRRSLAKRAARQSSLRWVDDPAGQLPMPGEDSASAVASLAEQLELLAQRQRVLSKGTWPSGDQAAIADFWIGQSAAYAEATLFGDARATFDDAWQAALGQTTTPKLLVLLESPGVETPSAAGASPGGGVDVARYRDALHRWAATAAGCPVYQLDADDYEAALREIVAAVEAMR